MPTPPPRDAHGRIVPHDHLEILDSHHVIRHTTPHDLHTEPNGLRRVMSGAFSESSTGGMSVDIEEWMTADGLTLFTMFSIRLTERFALTWEN